MPLISSWPVSRSSGLKSASFANLSTDVRTCVHIVNSKRASESNDWEILAPTRLFSCESVVSIENFLSFSDALRCEKIIIAGNALGRCALGGLFAIGKHLVEDGTCWIYQVNDQRPRSLIAGESQQTTDGSFFQLPFVRQQAERSGFEFVVGFSTSAFSNATNPAQFACVNERPLDGISLSVAVIRRREKTHGKPPLMVAQVGKRERSAICQLFNHVFSPSTMRDAHWEWKYGSGRGVAIGAARSGELVAHYGGIWRTIAIDGKTCKAVQITDVMVSPQERGIMGRLGAFSLVAPTFAECFVGHGAEALIGFGFPNERHFAAAQKRGLYGEVDRITEMCWPADSLGDLDGIKNSYGLRVQIVGPKYIQSNERKINRLWKKMRRSLPRSIIGVRDYSYLKHRYLENPLHQYEYAIFRSAIIGRWTGLAVLFFTEGCVEVRDILAQSRQVKQIIQTLRGQAWARGLNLKLWITESHKRHVWVEGASERATGIVIPISTWTNGPTLEEIRGRWWLMSGDTDFL